MTKREMLIIAAGVLGGFILLSLILAADKLSKKTGEYEAMRSVAEQCVYSNRLKINDQVYECHWLQGVQIKEKM